MPNIRIFQGSFSGGEITPEMAGRPDDAKFQTGLALCKNFLIKPHGPAVNRPGFAFVKAAKYAAKKARLIPFTYSTDQTMVIEIGEGYFRFHSQGGTLVLAATPDAWAPSTSYAVGNLVSNAGTNYYCKTAHTSIAAFATTHWYALPADGTYEVPNAYAEADLFDIHYVQSADVLTLVHPSYAPLELRRYALDSNGNPVWIGASIVFGAPILAPTGLAVAQEGDDGNAYTYEYTVTAFAEDGIQESIPATAVTIGSNLLNTGCTHTLTWTSRTGASRYNVYKKQGGVFGYIGSVPQAPTPVTLIDDNIAPDLSITPPTYDAPLSGAGNRPGAVSYYEQRRCFAGTINAPANFWATKSGTESAFSYSLPIRDDDRIAIRVAAREANTIRHIVPLSSLILLTSAAEWVVTSINSDAITPSSIAVKPQSYVGASNVQPVIVNNLLVYCAARGGHLRELGYNLNANGFMTGDLSLRATHLFDDQEILDMAFQKSPYPVLWTVSSNGNLLALTYIPEQQIGAVHQHETDGMFESVAVVAEGREDYLYAVVSRVIDGNTVRYVERMASRNFIEVQDAFFVDSGLTFDGTNLAATTVTLSGGTTWAAGELLSILADAPIFAHPATTDVGDVIVITGPDGILYRMVVKSLTSTTLATVQCDRAIPVALQSAATAAWAWARGSLSGLDHLEGAEVAVLADGGEQARKTVTSGAITLDYPAVKVHVGLPYESDFQTLPVTLRISGYGQGRFKNVNKVWVKVHRSTGMWAGPDEDLLMEARPRFGAPYGEPPALRTEEIELLLTPAWMQHGQVFIRQTAPLPLSVLGVSAEISLGG